MKSGSSLAILVPQFVLDNMNIEDNNDEIDVNDCTTLMLNFDLNEEMLKFDLNEEENISYERLFGNFDENLSSSPLTCSAQSSRTNLLLVEADFVSPQSSRTNLSCKDSLSNTRSPSSVSSQRLFSPETSKVPSISFPSTVSRHYEAYELQTPIGNTHPLKVPILAPLPSLFLQCDESAEKNENISTDNHLRRKRYVEEESREKPSVSPIQPYASRMKDYSFSPSVSLPIITSNTSLDSTSLSSSYNPNSPISNDKILNKDPNDYNLQKRRKL